MSHSGTRDRRKKDRESTPKSDVRADKQQPKAKPRLGDPVAPAEEGSKYMFNRTVYALMNFIGRVVQVQVKSGAIYEGIFHTANTDKGLGIVLKMAKKKDTTVSAAPIPTLVINSKEFVQLMAKDVTFDVDETLEDEGVFQTDTDISGHAGDVRERELLPWMPDEDDTDHSLSNTFDSKRGWDQFEVNEKLFGVKTSYQEELYTTALDRNSQLYSERSEEARRIASEIEGKASGGNIHLAEERGQVDTGAEEMDEEDRYSSVIRTDKYLPPAKRAVKESKDKEKDKKGKKEPPPRLERERSTSSLTSSSEDLGNYLPLSPGKGTINERIRLRLHIVNEKYKNTVPVSTPSDPLPTEGSRSPLLSPLVGNPKAINALSLEPYSPNIPEDVVRDFLEFSLGEKAKRESVQQKKSREVVTEQLKSFSRELSNRSSRPGSPLTMMSSPSLTGSLNTPPTQEAIANTMAQLAQNTSSSIPNPASPAITASPAPTAIPATTPPAATTATTTNPSTTASTTASTAATTTSTSTPAATSSVTPSKLTSKLNPNAKVFTPMSANAPVFTPKSFAPPQMVPSPAEPVYFQPLMNMGVSEPPRTTPDFSEFVGDIYCESLKRKHAHSPETAKTTVPYWMGPRGSYRNIAEEEAFYYTQSHGPAPPRHPMGVVGMAPAGLSPITPVPGLAPMAMNMTLPPGAVAGYPPQYVGVIPATVASIPISAQAQGVPPGAIYPVPHQGVRPFQPMQPGIGGVGAPIQPSYVYSPGPPGMPQHQPPGPPHHGQYQPPVYSPQLPHSPQTPPQMAVPQKRFYPPHMSPQQQPPILMPHSPSPSHPPQVYQSPPPNTSPSRPNVIPVSTAGTPPNRS